MASALLIDEYFESGNPAFLGEVLGSRMDKKLTALAGKWFRDTRPWAKEALLAYVEDGCDRSGHRGLVKRLFKLAEQANDDELMIRFAFAFDGLVAHRLRTRTFWDWQARESYQVDVRTRTEQLLPNLAAVDSNWKWRAYKVTRFTFATRRYLRRRALRYIRTIGFRDQARFRKIALECIALYPDARFKDGVTILDQWTGAQLLFHGDVRLLKTHWQLRVAKGSSVGELLPSPMHAVAHRAAPQEVFDALPKMKSRLARTTFASFLVREAGDFLRDLPVDGYITLLRSEYADLRVFAAERFGAAPGLSTLPLATWLELLAIDDLEVASLVAKSVQEHVDPARLTLEQCAGLARTRLGPVADLGAKWLTARTLGTNDELELALTALSAPVESARSIVAPWLMDVLYAHPHATFEHVREMVDSPFEDVRALGLSAVESDRFRTELQLFAALGESPYPDVRAAFIRGLELRQKGLPNGDVEQVLLTALMAVHTGSRSKRTALKNLSERIVREPKRADELLPILRVALRSVREAERRPALAAIARAVALEPSLREPIERHVPELKIEGPSTTAGAA